MYVYIFTFTYIYMERGGALFCAEGRSAETSNEQPRRESWCVCLCVCLCDMCCMLCLNLPSVSRSQVCMRAFCCSGPLQFCDLWAFLVCDRPFVLEISVVLIKALNVGTVPSMARGRNAGWQWLQPACRPGLACVVLCLDSSMLRHARASERVHTS